MGRRRGAKLRAEGYKPDRRRCPDQGERVMALLRSLYAGLRLTISKGKRAVASAFGRKLLGYSFWVARGRDQSKRSTNPSIRLNLKL